MGERRDGGKGRKKKVLEIRGVSRESVWGERGCEWIAAF